MKLRLVYTAFVGLLLLLVSLGNKNGRASSPPGAGNTGAPGDEALPNGTPILCVSCHTPSNIVSTTSINILNSEGEAVLQYIPGQQYTARVTVNTVQGNPVRWGFQMIALRNNGNTDLKGFSDQNPNNYKLATVNSTSRTYAEHDNASTSNVFNVTWTAPAAGTGNVTFYAAGNAVNNNGLNNGDGASATSLQLTEGAASSVQNPDAARISLQVWPNPIGSVAYLSATLPAAGEYRLMVHDLSGRLVWETTRQLPAGDFRLDVPAEDWSAGVHFVSLSGAGIWANIKAIKF
ncbi:MAG: hypothetical protein KIS77_08430 [Saprospiraceae bacterium]|nr:hypothetical protein [Saprospiraceae bacterium]